MTNPSFALYSIEIEGGSQSQPMPLKAADILYEFTLCLDFLRLIDSKLNYKGKDSCNQ